MHAKLQVREHDASKHTKQINTLFDEVAKMRTAHTMAISLKQNVQAINRHIQRVDSKYDVVSHHMD